MTAATPAQNAARLGNLAARVSAAGDELRKLWPQLRLSGGDPEREFATAMAGARMFVTAVRSLEARTMPREESTA